jgi:hypothetical protein
VLRNNIEAKAKCSVARAVLDEPNANTLLALSFHYYINRNTESPSASAVVPLEIFIWESEQMEKR